MSKEDMHFDEVAARLGCDVAELRAAAKERLAYHREYWMVPKRGLHLAADALKKVEDIAKGDKVVWGVVHRTLPTNVRWVWVTAEGLEGRKACRVLPRDQKTVRCPGKRIPMIHVEEDTYRYAGQHWRD